MIMKAVSNNINKQPIILLNIQNRKMLSVLSTLSSVNLFNCECFFLSRKTFDFDV